MTLITYTTVEVTVDGEGDDVIVKNIICTSINICIIIFMMFLGNRAITQSKKLSLKK